jgi:hypothetical protein
MRIDPAAVHTLPLPAALLAGDGQVWSATPEWQGRRAGSLLYRVGEGASLLISPDDGSEALDALLDSLLGEIRLLSTQIRLDEARRIQVLVAALQLVAGRSLAELGEGTTDDVIDLVLAALPARVPGITGWSTRAVRPPSLVRAPAAIALALLQFADNACKHERVSELVFRVDGSGPAFFVEWSTHSPGHRRVPTERRRGDRSGWGWVYIQMAADALGAIALAPREVRDGVEGVTFLLGGSAPGLPLARIDGGAVVDCSQSWNSDAALPALHQPVAGSLAELLALAADRPGQLVRHLSFGARRLQAGSTLVAALPETGMGRAREVLRGLAHEHSLWEAPEPHGSRAYTLVMLTRIVTGDRWPRVTKTDWDETFPVRCAALGVEAVPRLDVLEYPDPRLAAYLLAELRGRLEVRGGDVYVQPDPERREHPLMRLLSRAGRIRITPTRSDAWD